MYVHGTEKSVTYMCAHAINDVWTGEICVLVRITIEREIGLGKTRHTQVVSYTSRRRVVP